MKTSFFNNRFNFLFLALLSLLLTNCKDKSEKTSGDIETEKMELSARIDAKIDSFNNDLERLRDKSNEEGEDIRPDFRIQLNELEEERQRLLIQKQFIENATEDEWDSTRNEINKALEEIEINIDQELNRLENEIQD